MPLRDGVAAASLSAWDGMGPPAARECAHPLFEPVGAARTEHHGHPRVPMPRPREPIPEERR